MTKLLPKTVNNPQGFTLIELMVAISVVAILSVIGLVIYTDAQKGARDGRRRADLNALANAIEQKKDPTLPTYEPLAATDFASGSIPTDTTPAKYCGASAIVGATLAAAPTTWAATSACPAAPTGYTQVEATFPPATAATWRICVRLEKSNNQWVCRTNTQ